MGYSNPQAGQRTGVTISPRDALASYSPEPRFGRAVFDAANAYDGDNTGHEDELRPGTIVARITASKLWVPCKRSKAVGAGSSATALTVVDARAFKVADTIKIGSNAGCVISAINYGTNGITISAAKTWSDGDAVYCDSLAGSDVALGVLNEFVKLKDEDGVARNKLTGLVVLEGMIASGIALGDYATIRAATGMQLANLQWDDLQGQV